MRIVPYGPEWVEQFEREKEFIKKAFGTNCLEVHHIGSTSVPHLLAKPVIDILPVVKEIRAVDRLSGYEAKGEWGIPFRRYFQKEGVHVHVYEEGSADIDRHLKFRDYLRSHPQEADAYAALKRDLAAKFPNDSFNYCLGKEAFITAIEKKSGYRGDRMTVALTNREQAALHALRKQYFPHPQEAFLEEHLMFYHDTDIIGCAQIQPFEEGAVLRFFIIDEPFRYLGLGKRFLSLCEQWLTHQGVPVLYLHATEEASGFYLKQGYRPMPFEAPKPNEIELGKNLYIAL
jgi:GrpB-like predicted nucleotidyltransferase (UPF0157 family)/N-acetylglutamate synthase-like GNAT family acetyltransferase